ncbi:MAG: type II toxin-antitoxin system VapC family toxin [Treponema sp.]|nr:type II toxin-antitoxin system VapC family toxin [Treponema sp.]
MAAQYLLDTNICISLLKNKYGIREKVIAAEPRNCFISEITIAELYYGAAKGERKAERAKDVEFIASKFEVLPIFPALELFGNLKAELETDGNRIDDFDILIGSTALVNNLVMVTDNEKHLSRLPNITIENWKQA